ncbi:MAG: hypothetical protein M3P08_06140 [Thermoproteota archaeon]|nr:hypothetical protein [Thermoproteota archaeon]
MSIIAIGIFAVALVTSNSLVYAYLEISLPTEAQHIRAGSLVIITGTSTPANDTNHCVVSVVINGIRPFQKAIPIGNNWNGTEDYTSWKVTDNPSYATVKLGQNKITGKYS